MELALSLGDTSKRFSNSFLDKSAAKITSKDLGFCMGLKMKGDRETLEDDDNERVSSDHRHDHDHGLPVQLDLLPFSPVPRSHHPPSQLRFPWLADNLVSEPGSADGMGRGLDVNRFPVSVAVVEGEVEEGTTTLSSPNSTVSSFQMEFCIGNSRNNKRDLEIETHHHHHHQERASSRVSDDEENGLTRKKLRLSKEQSAFLEESFKEHNTLNPKQKLALAKQLNLRPRQVEVWFQNRRARTKLKQTEVDCEYLKRCCETLTEENRRLQKELQELRALKSSQPFYMQLPATTLTMCPSCERVATTTTTTTIAATTTSSSPGMTAAMTAATATTTTNNNNSGALQLAKPARLYPFPNVQPHMTQAQATQSAT